METKPVLYLSGPMTGIPNKNRPAFEKAKKQLIKAGYVVVSPWDLELKYPKNTWEECMRRDIIEMMGKCDAIATLPNWTMSQGACIEVDLAGGLGWETHSVDYWRTYQCRI